jgi:hypothetical protein
MKHQLTFTEPHEKSRTGNMGAADQRHREYRLNRQDHLYRNRTKARTTDSVSDFIQCANVIMARTSVAVHSHGLMLVCQQFAMKRQSLEVGSPLFFLSSTISMNHARSPSEKALISSTGKPRGRKSKSIPLPSSHVHRTQSELQLCEDMETAERRDLNMFYRLVNGIRDRQMMLVSEHACSGGPTEAGVASTSTSRTVDHDQRHPQQHPARHAMETERSLAHIIRTRNTPMESTSHFRDAYGDGASTSSVARQWQPDDGFHPVDRLHITFNQDLMQRQGNGTAAPLPAAEEDWSVSGFDYEQNGVSGVNPEHVTTHHPSSLHQPPGSLHTGTATSHYYRSGSSTMPASAEEADDGIFDLDF